MRIEEDVNACVRMEIAEKNKNGKIDSNRLAAVSFLIFSTQSVINYGESVVAGGLSNSDLSNFWGLIFAIPHLR